MITLIWPDGEPTPGQILARSARLIREQGWIQGFFGGPGLGGYCLFGAWQIAAEELDSSPEAMRIVDEALDARCDRHVRPGHRSHVDWNDEPGRTKEEVLALIEATIPEVAVIVRPTP